MKDFAQNKDENLDFINILIADDFQYNLEGLKITIENFKNINVLEA